jgi:hypothetical protein
VVRRPGEGECADNEGEACPRAEPTEREGEGMGRGGVGEADSVRNELGGGWYPGRGERVPKVTRAVSRSSSLAERDGLRRRMLLVLWSVGV